MAAERDRRDVPAATVMLETFIGNGALRGTPCRRDGVGQAIAGW